MNVRTWSCVGTHSGHSSFTPGTYLTLNEVSSEETSSRVPAFAGDHGLYLGKHEVHLAVGSIGDHSNSFLKSRMNADSTTPARSRVTSYEIPHLCGRSQRDE